MAARDSEWPLTIKNVSTHLISMRISLQSLMKVGLDKLAFEHRGWQASQCSTFASIFADAIKHGLPAIQTQHPGLYYQQAANYAVQRRKLAEELCR